MSDDFIPFNQSTPMKGKFQDRRQTQQSNSRYYQNNRFQNGNRRGKHQQWGNNSQRNSSYGSDSNSSFGRDNRNHNNIDAYLHPSMLQDPWAQLRQNQTSQ